MSITRTSNTILVLLFTMLFTPTASLLFLRSPVLRARRFNSLRATPFSNLIDPIAASSIQFDTVVIGGGHAGTEAASAAPRAGAKTLLITQSCDTVGELSCNPSVGGVGKGHIVREVDALGGVIGRAGDHAACHYRTLNASKGGAVRGLRVQADRVRYREAVQSILGDFDASDHTMRKHRDNENFGGSLSVVEGSVEDVVIVGGGDGTVPSVSAVVITDKDNNKYMIPTKSVVITTGTFLRGVIYLGRDRYSGGRHLDDSEDVEPPSIGLAETIKNLGFKIGRLKTGE